MERAAASTGWNQLGTSRVLAVAIHGRKHAVLRVAARRQPRGVGFDARGSDAGLGHAREARRRHQRPTQHDPRPVHLERSTIALFHVCSTGCRCKRSVHTNDVLRPCGSLRGERELPLTGLRAVPARDETPVRLYTTPTGGGTGSSATAIGAVMQNPASRPRSSASRRWLTSRSC